MSEKSSIVKAFNTCIKKILYVTFPHDCWHDLQTYTSSSVAFENIIYFGFLDIDHVTAHNYIIDERKIMIHYSLKNIALMHIYLYLLYIKTIKNVSGIIFLSKLNNHIGFKQHSELRLGLNWISNFISVVEHGHNLHSVLWCIWGGMEVKYGRFSSLGTLFYSLCCRHF